MLIINYTKEINTPLGPMVLEIKNGCLIRLDFRKKEGNNNNRKKKSLNNEENQN